MCSGPKKLCRSVAACDVRFIYRCLPPRNNRTTTVVRSVPLSVIECFSFADHRCVVNDRMARDDTAKCLTTAPPRHRRKLFSSESRGGSSYTSSVGFYRLRIISFIYTGIVDCARFPSKRTCTRIRRETREKRK